MGLSHHKHYFKWIETYASQEFWELTESIKDQLNRLAQGIQGEELDRLRGIFNSSSRWEGLFWDMADNQQTWTRY
jgi:thiaminase/transcriptional activator TenA